MRSPSFKKFLMVFSAILVAVFVMNLESSSYRQSGESLPFERLCSDGFFVSSALFESIGILSLISSWGAFDTLSYGASFLTARFTRREDKYNSFFDYVQARREEREERRRRGNRLLPLDFIITGLVMLAFSIVALLAQ